MFEDQALQFETETDPGVLAEVRKYAVSVVGPLAEARGIAPVQGDNEEIA
jgi:hypothetical protein